MFDVITVGGSTRDFFLISQNYNVEGKVLKLPWGEKIVAEKLIKEVGGGGCNAAVSFARAWLKTSILTKIGNDSSGENIAHRLKEENVDLGLIKIVNGGVTSTSIVLCNLSGEHSIVMYRGQNDEFQITEINWNELSTTGWVYLADVTATNGDPSLEIAKFCKEKDIHLAFIPGQHQLKLGLTAIEPVLRNVDVFILNVYEASLLLGVSVRNEDLTEDLSFLDTMLAKFSEFGIKTIVITADVHGARAKSGDNFYYQPAPKVENIVNTTGAGDAFASAFVASIIKERTIEEGLQKAADNAGSVLQHLGAQTGLLRWR